MSRASKLLREYLVKATNGEDLSEAKLIITAMLPYFVVEEDFCKLPFAFVSSIFRSSNEKLEQQDAMMLIENATKYYQKDAISFLAGIDCGHIGSEAAAAILRPLTCIPLIRELLSGSFTNKSYEIHPQHQSFQYPKPNPKYIDSFHSVTPERLSNTAKQTETQSSPEKKHKHKSHNKSPEKPKSTQYVQSPDQKEKPIVENSNIFAAISQKDFATVEYLLSSSPKVINERNQFNRTPLHFAVESDNLEMVKLLINAGSDVNSVAMNSLTPLFSAVATGDIEIVKFLVSSGADLKCRNQQQDTVIHLAIKLGNIELVRFFASKGVDLTAKNDKGQTPVIVAKNYKKDDIMQFLVTWINSRR